MVYSLLNTERDLGYRDFSGYIGEAAKRHKKYNSATAMYQGDMWDGGKGYIGPIPINGDSHFGEIMVNIKRTFVGRNVIQEVVDRAVDALLSKSPDWKIYDKSLLKNVGSAPPSPIPLISESTQPDSLEQQAENELIDQETVTNPKIKEAEMLLSEVWNRARLGDMLKASLTQFMITGRGVLRLYLSPKFFEDNENKPKDFFEVAKYIKVEHVDNSKATILDDGVDKLSVVKIDTGKKKNMLEISFVKADKTFVATVESGAVPEASVNADYEQVEETIASLEKNAVISSGFSMDGEITVDEICGKPFVTETMLQNNRALNLDLSLAVGVLIESGYAEMVMTNVSMETRDIPDPLNPGKTIKASVGLKRGPGVVNNLIGEQSVNADGSVTYEQPDVHFKEPSPLDTFVQGENLFYRQILSEAKQIHILIVGDAKASGEARIQARQDFVKKSQRSKPSLDIHGSWVLNSILNLAASAIEKDGYFSELGVLFDCKVYAGELSADEQGVVVSRYEKGLISRETAITLLGSEEPLLEIDKIKKDEADKLALQVKRLQATAQFGATIANGRPSTTGVGTEDGNSVAGTAGAAVA